MTKTAIVPVLLVMFTTSSTSLVGCETPEPATPQAESMTPTLRALKIHPKLEGGKNALATAAFDATWSEIIRAGYSATRDEEAADVIARLEVTISEEPSIIAVTVNGKRKVTYKVAVQMIVEGKDGTSIFLAENSHSSDDEDGPATTAKKLIGRLRSSGKLGTYASQRKREADDRDLRERKKRAKAEEEKDAEQKRVEAAAKKKEDDTWQAANVAGCTEPITPAGCDGTKAYLAAYPTGRYAAQARQAIEVGTVKIEILQMEADWKGLDLAACKAPKTSNDCNAIKVHLAKFPSTSTHKDEAREILAKVEKKLEQLEKVEKAKEAAEEAKRKREEAAEEARAKAEEKKAALESCKEQCRDMCIDFRSGGVRAPCFGRCMARDCK